MTEITNTAAIVSNLPMTNAPARPSGDTAANFNGEMQADDPATEPENEARENVDDSDQDLYQGLGDSRGKRNNRQREEDARRDPRFRFNNLVNETDPHDAGVMLRISLAQRGLHRENFEAHATYVNKLGGDTAADYFNALTGTHCAELGLYATGFAYTDWPTFCLDDDIDLNVLEHALQDRRLNANSEILYAKELPKLEEFSRALADASHSVRWLDQTTDELADEINAMEFTSGSEVAAMRLFDTGTFSAKLLSPLIDNAVHRLPPELAPGDLRYASLNVLMEAACSTPTIAAEIMADDQLSGSSIDQLLELKLQSSARFLDAVHGRINAGLDPTATLLRSKIDAKIDTKLELRSSPSIRG